MRTMISRCWLGAVLLCASPAFAGEPHIGNFTRYDTGAYVILTSRNAIQARRFMEDLVQFRMTLELMLGKRATPNPLPTTIIITSGQDWNNWLKPRQDVVGFFQPAQFSNFMAMNGESDFDESLHVMFHEYTHYYLASQFSGEYPPWFNEGLAELMAYAKFDKSTAVLRIPMEQLHQARSGNWIPFERLIQVDHNDPEYQSHNLMPSFYAESWLAVQYGIVENPDFGKQIFAYLRQINSLVPQADAARAAFGDDLSQIDKQLREFMATSDRHSGAIKLSEVPAVDLPAGTPVDELDMLATIADLMLESHEAADRIRPLIESLGRRDRNPARAAILAARLAQQQEDNAAFSSAVDKAEAAMAPEDWEQHRELANVLLMNGTSSNPLSTRSRADSDEDVRRAMKWFGEAIAHNGGDIEALWGYGTAAVQLNENLDVAEH